MISLNKDFLFNIINKDNNKLWRVHKHQYDKDTTHYLIKYNKPLLEPQYYINKGIYKSIVFDLTNNKILSFSPPKTIDLTCEEFSNEWNNEDVRIEEFIDGVMIQVYYNGFKWEVSTRSVISANTSFYHSYKTFKTMFNEACNYANLDIQKLNKLNVYSFVLQHPDNKIVVSTNIPKLYLVDIFTFIHHQHTTEINYIVKDESLRKAILDKNKPINVHYPIMYKTTTSLTDIDMYKEKFCGDNTDYTILGIIIKNIKTGKRCKLRNENYNYVKLLRGNQPNILYRYIELLKQNKIEEYLLYFKEDKPFFSTYKNRLKHYILALHNNYVSCYIKKIDESKDYPLLFRHHMYNLHQTYIKKNHKIYHNIVETYVYNLDAKDIFNILNFHSV